jgi:flagellar biosynthesis protein FlhB
VAEDLFDTQEKTEEPTARRLDEARSQGRFARSQDLTNSLTLLFVAGFLAFAGAGMAQALRGEIVGGIARIAQPPASIEQTVTLVRETLGRALKLIGPCIGIAALAAIVLHFLQAGGFYVVKDALKLRFDKFDVARNFLKMFGLKSWFKILVGLVKFAVIIGVLAWSLRARMDRITALNGMDFNRAAPAIAEILIALFLQVTTVLVVLGSGDYMFQRWQYRREMRMSKQQVKDESKQEDGDPHARRQIKTRMRAMIERPLRQTIPEATVVVTNPTHYSVALKYEEGKSSAPVVTAKGVDRVRATSRSSSSRRSRAPSSATCRSARRSRSSSTAPSPASSPSCGACARSGSARAPPRRPPRAPPPLPPPRRGGGGANRWRSPPPVRVLSRVRSPP